MVERDVRTLSKSELSTMTLIAQLDSVIIKSCLIMIINYYVIAASTNIETYENPYIQVLQRLYIRSQWLVGSVDVVGTADRQIVAQISGAIVLDAEQRESRLRGCPFSGKT